jgi:pimeloyl-ACP methyl ester carboxylesterase
MRCTSRDGTQIAYTRAGDGPAVILVDGALCHRGQGPNRKLADRLSRQFTVFSYDRRGRGESGDTQPYAVERELEDLAAVIDAAGGSAHLYGISSGAMLALEAAERLPGKVSRLALYEVPSVVDDSRPPVPETYAAQLEALLAAGRRSAAVRLFMSAVVGLPSMLVAAMPLFPGWSKNKACAHTLAYDAAVMGDTQRGQPLPAGRWTSVTAPTLVVCGAKSPAWMRNASSQLAEVVPNARRRTLEGQRHYVKADAIAPVLREFLLGASTDRVADAQSGVRGLAQA